MRKSFGFVENVGGVTPYIKEKAAASRIRASVTIDDGETIVLSENVAAELQKYFFKNKANTPYGVSCGMAGGAIATPELHLINDTSPDYALNETISLNPITQRDTGGLTYNGNEVVGWASTDVEYAGTDVTRGTYKTAWTQTYYDHSTNEVVSRLGFLFDETKLPGITYNRIGLSLRGQVAIGTNSPSFNFGFFNTHTSSSYNTDSSETIVEQAISGIDGNLFGATPYRQTHHYLFGHWMVSTPADYTTRSDLSLSFTDTTKTNSYGVVDTASVASVTLGNLNTTDRTKGRFRYSNTTNWFFNPKTKVLFYLAAEVDDAAKYNVINLMAFDCSDMGLATMPLLWEKAITVNKEINTNDTLFTHSARNFIEVLVDQTTGLMEIFYTEKTTRTIHLVKLDASYNLVSDTSLGLAHSGHAFFKLSDRYYTYHLVQAAVNEGELGVESDTGSPAQVICVMDLQKKVIQRGTYVYGNSSSSYIYYAIPCAITGAMMVWGKGGGQSNYRWMRWNLASPGLAINYLNLVNVGNRTKVASTQLKVIYETRTKVQQLKDIDWSALDHIVDPAKLMYPKPYNVANFVYYISTRAAEPRPLITRLQRNLRHWHTWFSNDPLNPTVIEATFNPSKVKGSVGFSLTPNAQDISWMFNSNPIINDIETLTNIGVWSAIGCPIANDIDRRQLKLVVPTDKVSMFSSTLATNPINNWSSYLSDAAKNIVMAVTVNPSSVIEVPVQLWFQSNNESGYSAYSLKPIKVAEFLFRIKPA